MRLAIKLIIVLSISIGAVLLFRGVDSAPSLAQAGPTATPLPYCEYYYLTVSTANVRACASSQCAVVTQLRGVGTTICTRGEADNASWLQVDLVPEDSTSPIYYISKSVVSAGVSSGEGTPSQICQSWYVADEQTATVYECASTACAVVTTLGTDEWTCSKDFGAWLYIEQSDVEVTGWVQKVFMVRGRDTRVATSTGTVTPRPTLRAGTPTVTPPPGTITVVGQLPACQIYHVIADQTSARTCAGADCAVASVLRRNDEVCIRGILTNTDWFVADLQANDTTSPLYAIRSADIAPGTPRDDALQFCEPFEPSGTQVINLRQCPSNTCPIIGTLAPGDWICVTDYQGEWVYAYVPEADTYMWANEIAVRSMGLDGTPTPAATLTPTIDPAAPTATATRSPTSAPTNTATQTPSPTVPVIGGTPQVITSPTPTSTATDTPAGPSPTPTPVCQPYLVIVVRANVRSCPSTTCNIVTTLARNDRLCVLGPVPFLEAEWFVVDLDPSDPTNSPSFISQDIVQPDPAGATPFPTSTPPSDGVVSAAQTPSTLSSTPTPIFTPIPTSAPVGDLLAQEITLAGLNIRNIELRSPLGSNSFRFRTPSDWFVDGTNILYLNINYNEIESNLDTGLGPVQLVSYFDVRFDNELVSTVALDKTSMGEQTIPILLPTRLLADPARRDHTVQLILRAEEHCLARSETRLVIRNDLSFMHFEYREGVAALDLALYPRPLFNEEFVNVTERAVIVLPPNPTANDYNAAASVVAGLGLLTGNALQIDVVTADQITLEQSRDFNLLLLGQVDSHPMIDDLYARGLLPSTLNANGEIEVRDTPIDQNDGVVQVIIHPANEKRGIVVVTGRNPDALRKAAQALAGPPPLFGLGGPIALIEDTRPVQRPPAGTTVNPDLTFAELGYPEIALNGIGSQVTEIEFSLPYNQTLTDGAYVDLLYTASDVVKNGRATITLLMNYVTPIASAYIDGSQSDASGTFGPSRLRAWIPPNTVIPGERNILVVSIDITGDWQCQYPDPDIAWFTIRGDSLLHLPTRFLTAGDFRPLVGWFPSPFNNLPDLSDTWIQLPDEPAQLDLQQAYQIVERIGASTFGGEGFRPVVNAGPLPPGTDLSAYNFIVIGRYTNNSFLAELNPNLKQPFVPGTDQLEQVLDDVSYRLAPGFEVGVLQTLKSPWAEDRMIAVITGTGPNGQSYALNTLVSGRYGRDELLGDVVFVSENSAISVVDTRTIENTADIMTAAAELPAQATLEAFATPTLYAFATVTPGPSLTPLPSITPFPSSTATPLFTDTPGPTTPTPFPTFEPLSSQDIGPQEVNEPQWLGILAIATTVILGLAALAVVVSTIRSGRRSV